MRALAIGYIGRGVYKVFDDRKLVGSIRTDHDRSRYYPEALTAHGPKTGKPVESLDAAKAYIDRKLIKHGR